MLQAEASHDRKLRIVRAGKAIRVGGLPLRIGSGPRHFASHFDNGLQGWGARFTLTMRFPG